MKRQLNSRHVERLYLFVEFQHSGFALETNRRNAHEVTKRYRSGENLLIGRNMHVSQLSGATLDDWVRRAEDRYGEPTERCDNVDGTRRYSKDENLARPIMDREGIVVSYIVDATLGAQSLAWVRPAHGVDVPLLGRQGWLGDNDLEAAMRCYVAITFGEEIPD